MKLIVCLLLITMAMAEALQALEKLPSDLVVRPESEEYDEILQSYYSGLNRELKPAVFFTPRSASQAAEIIKAVKSCARPSTIAICGAGQQTTPGVANVQGGLTFHLRNLTGVELDVEKNIVSVAAGEQMGKVYEVLEAAGLTVVGGRHSYNGIGGLAVQGELPYCIPLQDEKFD